MITTTKPLTPKRNERNEQMTHIAHTINNGALMIVDYYQRSDTWQCIDSKFTIKGRGKTRMGAICDAQNQWDEYLKKNE